MGEITTVIFDVGMVLADFAWKQYLEELYPDDRKVICELGEGIFLSDLWEERDVGLRKEEDYIADFHKRLPQYEREIDRIFSEIHRAVREYPYSAGWLKNVKMQGYRVLILSNFAKNGFEYLESHYSFIPYVDGIVVSYREQLAKPDKRIYERLLQRYGLTGSECIFIDDRAKNLIPAAELGIHTILFESREQTASVLKDTYGIIAEEEAAFQSMGKG